MNYDIKRKINKILNNRRIRAIAVAEQNLKIARSFDIYRLIEKKEAELKIKLANILVESPKVDITKINAELKKLNEIKIKFLKKIGLTLNDIEPNYVCKLCNDTGKDNCKCINKIKSEILQESLGIKLTEDSFEKAKYINKDLDNALKFMAKWCENYPNINKKTIFISGGTGVGKTFLSNCVVNSLVSNNIFVYYVTAFKLNQIFQDKYYLKNIYDDNFNTLIDCDVLIIDDLGTEQLIKNVTINYLYLILNERNINEKATIINSNLDADNMIDRYGERIFSRIFDKKHGVAFKLQGEDVRLKK